jgi:hypothetical protein
VVRTIYKRSSYRVIPDSDEKPFAFWQQQADILAKKGFHITLSMLLYERLPPDKRQKGYDLADALLHRDATFGWQLSDHDYPLFWDK